MENDEYFFDIDVSKVRVPLIETHGLDRQLLLHWPEKDEEITLAWLAARQCARMLILDEDSQISAALPFLPETVSEDILGILCEAGAMSIAVLERFLHCNLTRLAIPDGPRFQKNCGVEKEIHLSRACPRLNFLRIADSFPKSQMLAMLKNHATLEKATLRISWLQDKHLIALAQGAPCLVAINVQGAMRVTDISITVVAQHCSRLEFVNLNETQVTGASIHVLDCNCPSLGELYIDNSAVTSFCDAKLASLTKLHAHFLEDISSCEWQKLLGRLTLMDLRANGTYAVDALSQSTAGRCLKHLHLSYPPKEDMQRPNFSGFLANCSILESISLKSSFLANDDVQRLTTAASATLRQACFSRCRALTDRACDSLALCHSLVAIDLSWTQISDRGLCSILEHCRMLEEILLQGCKSCTAQSVGGALTRLGKPPNLILLDCSWCDDFDSDSAETIAGEFRIAVKDYYGMLHGDD